MEDFSFITYLVEAQDCKAEMQERTSYTEHLRFFRRDVGSLASRVLTRPKSCITRSSCRRSSWPFRRKTNSCPLLPVRNGGQLMQIERVSSPVGVSSKGPADFIYFTLPAAKNSLELKKNKNGPAFDSPPM